MDFATALGIATTVINTLIEVEPTIVKLYTDLSPFASALIEKFTGTPLTDDQRTALETKLDELHIQFQAAIPPADQQ